MISLIFSGLKKLFRLLRNFVHLVYREVREGLYKFARGCAFLFGKRQIKTLNTDGSVALMSRFDLDCDVITMGDNQQKEIIKTTCRQLL